MASIINATTTNGVVASGDNSGVLQLATNNGTTAVTINTSQNVGVGTTSPTNKLHAVSDVTDGTDTSYAIVAGAATTQTRRLLLGYNNSSNYGVIQAVESGTAWRNIVMQPNGGYVTVPFQPAFSAYGNSATLSSGQTLPYATTTFNIGGNYNTSTYRFTAPVTGVYVFIWCNKGTANSTFYTALQRNGGGVGSPMEGESPIANPHTHASAIIQMTVGDYVEVVSGSSTTRLDGADYFSGYLLG
jgi:hypothetical protein